MSQNHQSKISDSDGNTWMGGPMKQRSANPVPLSTASTAAPSPRLLASQSPPPGFSDPIVSCTPAPLLANPSGVFVNDSPPSPGLTKRLLGHAQSRKRAGRHNLVAVASGGSNRRILKLSAPTDPSTSGSQPVDRWGIPDDVYDSLLKSASVVKKSSGQHVLQRRRLGLSGEVENVLVIQSKALSASIHSPPCTVSLFSPDPSLF